MHALLHHHRLDLLSASSTVLDGWRAIFDLELHAAETKSRQAVAPAWRLTAEVLPTLPPLNHPAAATTTFQDGSAVIQVSHMPDNDDALCLHLARPARVFYSFADPLPAARLQLTPAVLDSGNLEDVTLIALAPLLRRSGLFLLHAFAVALDGRAALLAGPSGSGKSTAGLALALAGWTFLANDAALLRDIDGLVTALASPGPVNIAATSERLLPALATAEPPNSTLKRALPRHTLPFPVDPKAAAAVSAVFFPHLSDDSAPNLSPVPRAVGLARLMEQSLDQWDTPLLEAHIALLAKLSHQVAFYDLALPRGQALDPSAVADYL